MLTEGTTKGREHQGREQTEISILRRHPPVAAAPPPFFSGISLLHRYLPPSLASPCCGTFSLPRRHLLLMAAFPSCSGTSPSQEGRQRRNPLTKQASLPNFPLMAAPPPFYGGISLRHRHPPIAAATPAPRLPLTVTIYPAFEPASVNSLAGLVALLVYLLAVAFTAFFPPPLVLVAMVVGRVVPISSYPGRIYTC